METTYNTANVADVDRLRRLRISQKWSWIGPAAGIACMIALFVVGLITKSPGLTVMSASIAAALGGVWAGVSASIRGQITKVAQG